jgi:glucokinase
MIAAVDIGGTKIAAGLIDAEGRVLTRSQVPTDAPAGYRSAIERTVEMLRAAELSTGQKITGIGIGSTGPIFPLTGAIGDVPFFPNWINENPVKDLEAIFKVGVAIENDADASALGEASWGAGRNKKRLVYVTVGTGIGVGLILDRKVYRGVDYSHPEVGHHVIDPSGPLCSCGFSGCWESLATGPAMEGWFAANADSASLRAASVSAAQICELARGGDAAAVRAVERTARYLALGIANLVTLFVPDAIVLGGSVMKSSDLFMDTIRRTVATSCRYVPYESTEIALASLGDDANLIGAARVWYHKFSSEESSNAS